MSRHIRLLLVPLTGLLLSACSGKHDSTADAGVVQPTSELDAGAAPQVDAAVSSVPAPVAPSRVCSSDGWCWDAPGVQGNTLNAIAASSPSDFWAIGSLGLALHFDGASFRAQWAPSHAALRAIWLSGTDPWVVGDAGTVLHWSGQSWDSISIEGLSADVNLRGVAGDGAGTIWIVGDGGTLFEQRNAIWSRVDAGTTGALNAIWFGNGKTYAVGAAGVVIVRDGDTWARSDAGTTRDLFAVQGDAKGVWVAGSAGDVRRYDLQSKRWERPNGTGTAPTSDIHALQLGSDGRVYLGATDGSVYLWDAAALCPVPGDASAPEQPCPKWASPRDTGQDVAIGGLWVDADQSIAVGADGLLVAWSGADRRILTPGSLDNYLNLSGNDEVLWAAGDRLLQKSQGVWTEVQRDSPRAVYALQATADGRILVAGTGGMARSYASRWESMDVRADAWLHGLAINGGSGWLVGSRGLSWGLLNGHLWTPLQTPTQSDLLAVWSSSGTTAWAVGEGGVTLHHDGTQWAAVPSGPDGGLTVDLHGVWGSGETDVWAVGTGGSAVHWDGTRWTRVTPDASYALNAVWGRGPQDIWSVGSTGTLLHYDGVSWQQEFSGTEHTLNAVWGNAKHVWVAGEHGTILVKDLTP
ncbi:MAG TPA: hypothetical protein VG963_18585 [Polyangiaceae bacterium]|nr:hypothetical protein [Polyangiaceae bacterium]